MSVRNNSRGVRSGHPLKHANSPQLSVVAEKEDPENSKIKFLGSQKNPQKSVNFILPIRFKCDRLVAE